MDNPQDFKSLQDRIQAALVTVTRSAGQIASEDLGFQRSFTPAFGTALDEQSARLLDLSSSLLKSAGSISQVQTPELQDIDDVENNWRSVVEVLDSLLEKADTSLDEYTGAIKQNNLPTMAPPSAKSKKYQSSNLFRNQNLVKPQLGFQHKPNNADTTPWRPLITSKPHAIVPIDQSFVITQDEAQRQQYRHPYETEILELQYPDAVYQKADPILYLPVESTSATFVDTLDGVVAMLGELKNVKEIAVDLEHHDARSYVGLVSLMQISTRDKDWVVDTLKPWRQDLQILNEVFADPQIIKVFHGAYMDIVWLQRDLGLYVVGLFDTYHASRTLGYSGASLAYLLKRFVNFDADKKYQMADWRIRPLPDEMFFYARADTHYLLYIYDHLRNELIERSDPSIPEENRIELVLQRSKETSLLRFERQNYDETNGKGPGGWQQLLSKKPGLLTNEQFAVFKAVHGWRDWIARKDDEGTNHVMPNHVVFTLAKLMPMDMGSLYGALPSVSYNVRSRASELLGVIASAKASGKNGPSMMDTLRPDSVALAKSPGKLARSSPDTRPDGNSKGSLPNADLRPLRSETSRFWGTAFGSSIWDPSSKDVTNETGLELAVPLPELIPEAFADVASTMVDRSPPRSDHDLLDSVENLILEQNAQTDEDTFNLKSGKKRKATEIETNWGAPEDSAGDYDIVVAAEKEERAARAKKSNRAARRARKKQERAAIKLVQGEGIDSMMVEAEEEEVFDYSKADSVLHGKAKAEDGTRPKQKKPFDPYAKNSDAPRGMRRLQTERPGKSITFKS